MTVLVQASTRPAKRRVIFKLTHYRQTQARATSSRRFKLCFTRSMRIFPHLDHRGNYKSGLCELVEPMSAATLGRLSATTQPGSMESRGDLAILQSRPLDPQQTKFFCNGLSANFTTGRTNEGLMHHYRSNMKNSRVNNAMTYTPRECRDIAS